MKFLLGKFSAELTKHVSHLQYPALQVLEGMRGELASAVLAASSLLVGERAWRLPERLHPLDEAISALQERSVADQLTLQRLKKQKLRIKDKIAVIEDRLTPDIIA